MFSTDVHKELPKSSMSKSFIEWFVGLCDAESNLSVGKRLNEKRKYQVLNLYLDSIEFRTKKFYDYWDLKNSNINFRG